MRRWCSLGKRRWTGRRGSATQATADGYSGFHLAMNRLARRRPSATASSPSCLIWSKIAPVVPLHLALGMGGDLGGEVAADVDQAALMQAGGKRALDSPWVCWMLRSSPVQ
jgi:hypothetical protein